MAKIAVIVGSVRSDRQGIKLARWDGGKIVKQKSHRFFHQSARIEITFLG
jgi:hypothetical protein